MHCRVLVERYKSPLLGLLIISLSQAMQDRRQIFSGDSYSPIAGSNTYWTEGIAPPDPSLALNLTYLDGFRINGSEKRWASKDKSLLNVPGLQLITREHTVKDSPIQLSKWGWNPENTYVHSLAIFSVSKDKCVSTFNVSYSIYQPGEGERRKEHQKKKVSWGKPKICISICSTFIFLSFLLWIF